MSSKNDTMIFCTFAKKNHEEYLRRVLKWKDMLKNIDADLFCISDGVVPFECSKKILDSGIMFIELTSTLGRTDCFTFEGFKRSYGYGIHTALLRGYKYVAHVENDIVINNMDKFLHYLKKDGLYSSWNKHNDWMESAFQIVNNRGVLEALNDRYTSLNGISEKTCFEREVEKYGFEYPFTSYRLADGDEVIPDADFTAQSYGLGYKD